MNILFIGDIVGNSGVNIIREKLPSICSSKGVNFVIANGENAASGMGLTRKIMNQLFDFGIDVITMGNHTWAKREIFDFIDDEEYLIRPANVSDNWPGKGFVTVKSEYSGAKISVVNLMGQIGMTSADCPFRSADKILKSLDPPGNGHIIFLDFHAEATSEKAAIAGYLDGRVSLICGTHTHVQTADERILPGGTGFITDVGMTGPTESVIGMEIECSLKRFVNKLPQSYKVASGPGLLSAVFAKIDKSTGRTVYIERICVK